VSKGKFREDLYYRLNAVVIPMPALRERPADINVLFRKFASDFSSRYGICKVTLTEDASILLRKYRWPGNIRQLKNVAEGVSALESVKISGMSDKCVIDVDVLSRYIPKEEPNMLPAKVAGADEAYENPTERAAILRMLYSLKQDVDYLKEVVAAMGGTSMSTVPTIAPPSGFLQSASQSEVEESVEAPEEQELDVEEAVSDDLSIKTASKGLIEKVLKKHGGNRKAAAAELGISERTLYRKIKSMNLE
jgi:transcriptional regulator with PAS, ATPase and Fis domain